MEKIIPFSINQTKNQSLLSFMPQYMNWFEANPEIKAKVLPLYNNSIVPLSKKIELAVKKLLGSEHTANMATIDVRRGNAWTGFGYGVRMYMLHPDKEFSEPAKRANRVVKNFVGLNNQEYSEQTGGIKAALKELRGDYAADVEKLGLVFWLDEMEDANNDFIKLDDARDDQVAKKNAVDIKVIRKDVNGIIKTTSDFLNGLAFMESGDPEMAEKYDTAFRKLNVILKKFGAGSTATQNDRQQVAAPTENGDDDGDDDNLSPEEPITPTEPVVEETHEEKMAKARPYTEINEGEWKNGDYCWHMLNSVKTYWKLLDATQKTVKPYMSGGEAVWEKL